MAVLMARGDHRADLRGFFAPFNYTWTDRTEHVSTWRAALEGMAYPRPGLSRHLVHKAVCFASGWTVVLDPELLMFAEEAPCTALATRLGAPVFGAVCEGTSATYGFSYFNPDRQRSFLVSDSEVQEDVGTPLEAEAGIATAALFEDDVLLIMKRVGVDYLSFEGLRDFVVVELDESHLGVAAPETLPATTAPTPLRPWWQFW